MREKKIDRLGETMIMNCGAEATIIKYNKTDDVIVEFKKYNEKVHCAYREFKNGSVKSNYEPIILNKGYIGVGKYNSYTNGKISIQYDFWRSMLRRCYENNFKEKHETYKEAVVCDEWLNFQNFAEWFDVNYYTVDNERMQLDKDILHKGNKIYSPENCVFVPQNINKLFCKCDKSRGEYPIGVDFNKQSNKFRARCSVYKNGTNKSIHLGKYNSPEDAFYKGYKPFKEKYIKQVAEEYKNQIPKELYDALYKYKVEITD